MKKNLIIIFSILTVMFFTACPGIPSPTIGFIEVLDEDYNVINNCDFSVLYKNQKINDLFYDFHTMDDESFEKACNGIDGSDGHRNGFIIGKSFYEIGAIRISNDIKKEGDIFSVLSQLEITVSKDSYKSETFRISKSDMYGGYVRKTIILERDMKK